MHSYAVLIAVAIALLAPATAPAVTTVSGSQGCGPPTYRGVQDCFALVTATGDGAASEVTATREPHALVVHDPFGVVAGERCAPVPGAGGSAVRCTFTLAGHPSLSVDGGPGDDRLLVPFAAAAGGPGDDIVEGSGRIEGGPGDDVLRGASSDDILGGGPGADAIDGGAGEDLADYRDHDTPVSVALGSDAAAGSAGEGDRLSGVEGVLGGSGDDVLRGGDGGDLLLGGPGDDELRGGDGDDRIVDVDGRDLLVGGAGDDYLLTTDDHSFRLISDVLPGRSGRAAARAARYCSAARARTSCEAAWAPIAWTPVRAGRPCWRTAVRTASGYAMARPTTLNADAWRACAWTSAISRSTAGTSSGRAWWDPMTSA